MKKKLILILIIGLLNFCSQNVFGQEVLDQKISTDEFLSCKMSFLAALEYALKNNNNIKAARNHLCATEKDIGIVRSDMLPHAKFHEDFLVTNNPIEAFTIKLNQTRAAPKDLAFGTLDFPGATANFLTAVVLEQSIIDKKRMIAIKMAKKEYSANTYAYFRKREELIQKVAQACLRISTDKDTISAIELGIKDTQEHLAIAQDKFKKDKGFYSAVLRAKSAVEDRKQDLMSANKNLEISRRNLGLLLGLENPVEITDSIPEIKFNDINYYNTFALYRNDVKAMEIRVENAKNNVKHEQADWYPTLNAAASYNFYDPYYPFGGLGNNYIAAAYLRWDIFDGNKRKYSVEKAKYQEAEAKEYLEELKKEVNFKVYERYTHVILHQKNLEFAKASQKAAEEAQVLIEKYWNNSQLPFVSVIESQDNLDKARLNLVNTQFELKNDLIILIYESGIIFPEFGM